jgi:hypothetical protein
LGFAGGSIEFDYATNTPSPTPVPELLLSHVKGFVVPRRHIWNQVTVIGRLENQLPALVCKATVETAFYNNESVFPAVIKREEYGSLNPGDSRFFKTITYAENIENFTVSVDWIAWPDCRAPNSVPASDPAIDYFSRVMSMEGVTFERCEGPWTESGSEFRRCYFNVSVKALVGAARDVNIGLFDSDHRLIDVISTKDGQAGTGRRGRGSDEFITSIWADAGTTQIHELYVETIFPVENMDSWEGGPW